MSPDSRSHVLGLVGISLGLFSGPLVSSWNLFRTFRSIGSNRERKALKRSVTWASLLGHGTRTTLARLLCSSVRIPATTRSSAASVSTLLLTFRPVYDSNFHDSRLTLGLRICDWASVRRPVWCYTWTFPPHYASPLCFGINPSGATWGEEKISKWQELAGICQVFTADEHSHTFSTSDLCSTANLAQADGLPRISNLCFRPFKAY